MAVPLYCCLFLLSLSLNPFSSVEACNNDNTKTIIVNNTGTDFDCTTTTYTCPTLEYALTSSLVTDCTRIILYDSQTLNGSIVLKGINGLTIEGEMSELIEIFVTNEGGLEFVDCSNVHLEWLNFIDGKGNGSDGSDSPILHFNECTNISLMDSNYNLTSSILMTDNKGTVNINCVSFTQYEYNNNNYSLLKVQLSKTSASNTIYSVSDSSFNGILGPNSNIFHFDERVNNLTHTGGGLSIKVNEGVTNISVFITDSNFTRNTAVIGGGLYIKMHSSSSGAVVVLDGVSFIENKAMDLGGGLYIAVTDDAYLPQQLFFYFSISSCSFVNNIAEHGGGLAYQTIGQRNEDTSSVSTLINDCRFESNTALFSGAAAGLFKWEAALGGETPLVNLTDCTFTDNAMILPGEDRESTVVGSGTLYSQKTPISLNGHTVMTNNYGTAILASSILLQMHGKVDIMKNRGIRGGGINLIGDARIIVGKGLELSFVDNYAEMFGGVVYHVFPVFGVIDQNQYCTFQYEDATILDPTYWDADISFLNNTALESGDSIYISSPDSCLQNEKGYIFTETSTFHFYPSYTGQIVTPPINIYFTDSSGSYQCDSTRCTVSLMLGEELTLTPHAVDGFNEIVNSFALIDLYCIGSDGTLYRNKSCQYELGGSNLIELSNKSIRLPFFIKGAKTTGNVVLVWQTIQQPSVGAYLYVNITDCYLGYVYNAESRTCTCYNKSEVIFCNSTDYTACVNIGYWYGKVNQGQVEAEFAAVNCPFGSCNYTISGLCPTESCGPDGSPQQFYCKLPRRDPDKLCLFNRGGPICSGCRENFEFSFDAVFCVSNDKCSSSYIALYIFLSLLFWSLLISAILLITKLDLRIGSGQLYSVIFFFSVMQFFVHGSFPSYGLYTVELIITGFIQLDPKMFGLIEVCTPHNIGPIEYAALHYVNPLFLMGVIALLIYVSNKWPKYTPFAGDSSAVNMICIVIYLVFFSLTQTSLSILQPIQYSGIATRYVALDPSLEYFDPKGHLPYAIVALVIETVLVMPFLLLLIFAPYLIRFKRLNLTRIKPLLDEYQACYKVKYRSFAGFYLTFRQLTFFFSLFNLGISGHIYVLQILSILFLTIHCLVQPYTSHRLNILDGLLILDLVLLSILHGNTANVVFDDIEFFKIILVYLLILLPLAYLALLCLVHLLPIVKQKLQKFVRANHKSGRKKLAEEEESGKREANSPATTVVSLTYDVHDNGDAVFVDRLEREPLLFAINNDDDGGASMPEQNGINGNYNAVGGQPSVSVVELSATVKDE